MVIHEWLRNIETSLLIAHYSLLITDH